MKKIDFDTKTNTSERKILQTSLRGVSRHIRVYEEGIKCLKSELEVLRQKRKKQ